MAWNISTTVVGLCLLCLAGGRRRYRNESGSCNVTLQMLYKMNKCYGELGERGYCTVELLVRW